MVAMVIVMENFLVSLWKKRGGQDLRNAVFVESSDLATFCVGEGVVWWPS